MANNANTPMKGHGPGRGMRMGGQKPKNLKKTFAQLMTYLAPYRLRLILVVIAIVASAGCTVTGSYLLKPIINEYILPGNFSGLAKILLLMGCLYVASAAMAFFYGRTMVFVGQNATAAIRRDLFAKLQELPLSYFDTHPHGDTMSRFTNDCDTISEALNNAFANLISCALTFVGTLIMLTILSPALTAITVVCLVGMLSAAKFMGSRARVYFRAQQGSLAAVNGYIEEMIAGQKVVKVFGREEIAMKDFDWCNEEYRQNATRAQTVAGSVMPVMGNLSHVTYAITCCVGAIFAVGSGDLGTLVTFLNSSRQVTQPLTQISQQTNTLLSAAAGAERIFELMETMPEEDRGTVTLVNVDETGEETTTATHHWAWKDGDTLIPLAGDVRLENVVFGYNPEIPVLKSISLYANPGQKIAFVGSTGAGKTTITNLINRFYDIQSGTITYDGIDIRRIQKESLRRSLGTVLQDTHLFTGTVAENIRFGKLDATDQQVVEAAKLANAHTFIRHLPQGYDTVLTDDGGSLSQGERQLLGIARAACADTPVLVLDEATSSIDTRTEGLIQDAMDNLMAERTVFVIAHRLSTIRNAKAIMVLEAGEILERGNHEELLAQKGRYYQLYTGQAELD